MSTLIPFGRRKFICLVFFAAVLLTAAGGCVFRRAPAQKEAAEQSAPQPPAAGRMGDLRVRSGDLFFPASGVAQGQGGREQGERQEKPGPLPRPQGSGAGGVTSGRAAVEQTYLARLRSAAGAYEEKISALYGRAERELNSLPPGDTQKRMALAAQYYAAGRALESECDGIIYRELAAFEEALRAHGYPLDRAQEAREVYERTKKQREAQLLERAGKLK